MARTPAVLVALLLAAASATDYSAYQRDSSPVGQEVTCTDAEKACYRLNRTLHTDGKCYMLAHVGPCTDSAFFFDKELAQKGEFKATCQPTYRCGEPGVWLMDHDQMCHASDDANAICDYKRNLTFMPTFYGAYYCACFGDACPPKRAFVQPEEAGKCVLPALIHSTFPYLEDPLARKRFHCDEDEKRCLTQGQMLYEGQCYKVLERGPCAEGERLVVEREGVKDGQVRARCEPAPCPEDHVRMAFDGKCYTREDATDRLCPPHKLVFDVHGDAGCGFPGEEDAGVAQLPVPLQHIDSNWCHSRKMDF